MNLIQFLNEESKIQDLIIQYEQDGLGTININEAGSNLQRVISQAKDKDFIIITASRAKFSRSENAKRNNELLKSLRIALGTKIGAYKIVGHWKEAAEPLEPGQTFDDYTGPITNALEDSWLIVKPDDISIEDLDNQAQILAKKYDQDAYVFKSDNSIFLKGKDGDVWNNLGSVSTDSVSRGFEKILNTQGYSELKKLRDKGRIQNIVFENLFIASPKDNISSKQLFETNNIWC